MFFHTYTLYVFILLFFSVLNRISYLVFKHINKTATNCFLKSLRQFKNRFSSKCDRLAKHFLCKKKVSQIIIFL